MTDLQKRQKLSDTTQIDLQNDKNKSEILRLIQQYLK